MAPAIVLSGPSLIYSRHRLPIVNGGPRPAVHTARRSLQGRLRDHASGSRCRSLELAMQRRRVLGARYGPRTFGRLSPHERVAELRSLSGAAEPTGPSFSPRREAGRNGGRAAHPVVSPPKNLAAVLFQPHAARLRVQPLEPFLTELAVGYPPSTAIGLGAQEVLEDAGLAGHQTVAMIGDGNGDAEWRVEVNGLAGNRLFEGLVAKHHRLGVCRPAREDANTSDERATHEQKDPRRSADTWPSIDPPKGRIAAQFRLVATNRAICGTAMHLGRRASASRSSLRVRPRRGDATADRRPHLATVSRMRR